MHATHGLNIFIFWIAHLICMMVSNIYWYASNFLKNLQPIFSFLILTNY